MVLSNYNKTIWIWRQLFSTQGLKQYVLESSSLVLSLNRCSFRCLMEMRDTYIAILFKLADVKGRKRRSCKFDESPDELFKYWLEVPDFHWSGSRNLRPEKPNPLAQPTRITHGAHESSRNTRIGEVFMAINICKTRIQTTFLCHFF